MLRKREVKMLGPNHVLTVTTEDTAVVVGARGRARTYLSLALFVDRWPRISFQDGALFLLLIETPQHLHHGGGCTQVVHGRSRMTVDPRIPTMPGRSTLGFHQTGRHCLHQARSAVRCSASRMKGELHPSKISSRADIGTL